ncbi:AAEL004878-PA [Aedes aegypti]|uniref:AAEL004878-PA n=1 Tax=Aedes aegypti TaxID=7159 RepID=Q17BT0_AEDAE|nr:AAEL004878-PA [Aedes aegypti]
MEALNRVVVVGEIDPIPVSLRALNPFIKHWEPARFDRSQLEVAHRHHETHRRRRRGVNYDHGSSSYGPANVVRLNFHAHDRDFRLVLREDPSSVFARDIQIDNTEGPVDFDLSRVYTGIVEGWLTGWVEDGFTRTSSDPEMVLHGAA